MGLAEGNLALTWDAFGTGEYVIEATTDLTGAWTQEAGPLTETSWSTPLPDDKQKYYRVSGSQ